MNYKIAVISGSRTMTLKFLEEIENQNLDILVKEVYSRSSLLNEVEELILKGVKVFISRGNTASILRKYFDVPIVDVRHTFFDCYNSYLAAKEISDKIAFLATSKPFLRILEKSQPHLPGVKIFPIDLHSDLEKVNDSMNQLADHGIEVAIGGLTLEPTVTKLGINYMMTGADIEAIQESLSEADHLLKIDMEKEERRIELENKYELINSIFNCTYEGIISIDQDGLVTNMNHQAMKVLGDKLIGKHIYKLISVERINQMFKNNSVITNEIIHYNNTSYVINSEPVKVNNQTVGAVITFQQANQIQEIEQKIRKNMLKKGHVSDKRFDDIIGDGEKITQVKVIAKRYAEVDSTILIYGETGTGKELFAQSIHNHSKRNEAPFVAINCAAFPPSVLESELFGYVKGAFTGALNEGKLGIFELAHKGTIFLDEISELPLDVQLKLLRVIQERKIIRIGDDKVIPIDVRIITASNKNLKEQIKKNLFREDFYYRICVLELNLPTLNERTEDIPMLIRNYMESKKHTIRGITNKAMDMLTSAQWPGNVRQLYNIVERLIVTAHGDMITSDLVKEVTDITDESENSINIEVTHMHDSAQNNKSDKKYDVEEEELIKMILFEEKGNRYNAAKRLGISKTTLWRKLNQIESIDENYLRRIKYGKI